MILTLKELAEDFVRMVHASIVDQRYYQDFYYLGHIYRVRIKHLKFAPKHRNQSKYPVVNRTKIEIPRNVYEVSKCVTCGGPSVGPVCMFKGCEVVTNDPPRPTI